MHYHTSHIKVTLKFAPFYSGTLEFQNLKLSGLRPKILNFLICTLCTQKFLTLFLHPCLFCTIEYCTLKFHFIEVCTLIKKLLLDLHPWSLKLLKFAPLNSGTLCFLYHWGLHPQIPLWGLHPFLKIKFRIFFWVSDPKWSFS